jgi:N-acetyl-alpha-D-muramate 1-phosphate uridylyltransferase
MVLAAGLGTRMRPLTDTLPKPLVRVGGRTMLDHNLDKLEKAGVERAIVNVHYLGEQIIDHLSGRERPAITLSDEREALLDSGGGILNVLPSFGGEPFFTLNADTIWIDGPRQNLERMAAGFDPAMMDALLLLAPAVTSIGWGNKGDFILAQDGRIRRPDKGEVAPFAYTGVAILKPSSFIGKPAVFSLNAIFDEAIEAGRLYGLRLDGVFMHIGTVEALHEAERALTYYER